MKNQTEVIAEIASLNAGLNWILDQMSSAESAKNKPLAKKFEADQMETLGLVNKLNWVIDAKDSKLVELADGTQVLMIEYADNRFRVYYDYEYLSLHSPASLVEISASVVNAHFDNGGGGDN